MTSPRTPDRSQESSPGNVRPCSLQRRMTALIYDGLILIGLWMLGAAVIVVPAGGAVDTGTIWFQIYLLVLAFAYLGGCWWLGGQTVGMRAWKIRLVSQRPFLKPAQLAIRFGVGLVSIAALGAGFWTAGFRADHATWHDRISHTRLQVD